MRFIPLLFILLSAQVFSQDYSLLYSERLSEDSIRENLLILASDSLEGRETGKPGQKKAAKFIAGKYSSWGLSPLGKLKGQGQARNFLQDHPVSIRSNKEFNLVVNEKKFLYGRNFFCTTVTDTLINIESISFIGSGKEEAIVKALKEGKPDSENIFLLSDNETEISRQLIGLNVKSVFIISDSTKIRRLFTYPDSAMSFKFPVFYVTDTVAEVLFPVGEYSKIKAKWLRKNRVMKAKIDCKISVTLPDNTEKLRGQNVVAFLPGTSLQNETVVISAHYDHLGIRDSAIYYGADDNASGTAGLIEIARVFSEASGDGRAMRRNILFLNVSGEEKGLLGSSWFVTDPPIPMSTIVADLNIDMIGRLDSIHEANHDSDYVYIIGASRLSSELQSLNESRNEAGPKLKLDYLYDTADDPNRFYTRSDHYNFAKNGIPVIFYFDGKHVDYHKPSDTPDKIIFSLLRKRAMLVFLTAWELANRPSRPIVDKSDKGSK